MILLYLNNIFSKKVMAIIVHSTQSVSQSYKYLMFANYMTRAKWPVQTSTCSSGWLGPTIQLPCASLGLRAASSKIEDSRHWPPSKKVVQDQLSMLLQREDQGASSMNFIFPLSFITPVCCLLFPLKVNGKKLAMQLACLPKLTMVVCGVKWYFHC